MNGTMTGRREYTLGDYEMAWRHADQDADRSLRDYADELAWAQAYAVGLGRKIEDTDLTDGPHGARLCRMAVAFLLTTDSTFEYVVDLREKWLRWGALSVPQLRGALNCVRAEALRQQAASPDKPFNEAFPQVAAALRHAVEHAKARAAAKPAARRAVATQAGAFLLVPVGDTVVKLSVAGERSRYTGDIHVAEYVSSDVRHAAYVRGEMVEGAYYGRLSAETGEVTDRLQEHPAILAVLRELEADPATKIREFSRLIGRCCVCGRTLTNEKSIEQGIGPICADRVGW